MVVQSGRDGLHDNRCSVRAHEQHDPRIKNTSRTHRGRSMHVRRRHGCVMQLHPRVTLTLSCIQCMPYTIPVSEMWDILRMSTHETVCHKTSQQQWAGAETRRAKLCTP